MPLNEAKGYKSQSNLTKEQRREAEAAIYGIDPHARTMPTHLTSQEIETMRALLKAHDGATKQGIREFDLNNPPKVPYIYQEYPKMAYHHAKRTHRVAADAEEFQEALDNGWSAEPYPAEVAAEDVPLDAASAAEAAEIDAKLNKRKRS